MSSGPIFPHRDTTEGAVLVPKSLTQILFVRAAVVALGALALYSVSELVFDPPTNLVNFLSHHLLHVLGIGVVVWFACWFAIQRNVLLPIAAIVRHLHLLRLGRLQKLLYPTRSEEISSIITGINLLAERIARSDSNELDESLTCVQQLRLHLNELKEVTDDEKLPLMRSLSRLVCSLLGLLCKGTKKI